MTSTTKYPKTITQTTGNWIRGFANINNIKNGTSSYAETNGTIKAKNTAPDRPATITCTNFGLGIPSAALVTKVTVQYRHNKIAYGSGVCSIPAPTVSLVGVSGASVKSVAPYKNGSNVCTHTFNKSFTPAQLNSNNFGVRIAYGQNTNNKQGYVRLFFVRVIVEYKLPSISLGADTTGSVVTGSDYDYHLTINDANASGYNPNVQITIPSGFNLIESSGNGSITRVSDTLLKWDTKLSPSVRSNTINIKFSVDIQLVADSTTVNIVANESYGSTSKTQTVTVTKPSQTSDETSGEGTDPLIDDKSLIIDVEYKQVKVDEIITVQIDEIQSETRLDGFCFPVNDNNEVVFSQADTPMESHPSYTSYWSKVTAYHNSDYEGIQTDGAGMNSREFKFTDYGRYVILVYNFHTSPTIAPYISGGYAEHTPLIQQYFEVKPDESELTIPNFTKTTLTDEEFERMGDGYPYILQTDLKEVTSEPNVRDWYRNFRIGVFNNPIESNIYHTIYITSDTYELDVDFLVPTLPSDNCTATFEADQSIVIMGEGVVTEYTKDLSITDTELSLTLRRYRNNEVNLTYVVEDENDNTLYTMNYNIKFNQSESHDPEEVVTDTTDYDNLTDTQIFANAEYWSNAPTHINTFENLECEFVYNDDYPLFILITGDYPEGDQENNTVQFNDLCIIEKEDYTQRKATGIYPTPITGINNGTAELTLEEFTNSDKTISYKLPIDESFDEDTSVAIRGIEVNMTLEYADEQSITCTLKDSTGKIGQRSTVIDDITDNNNQLIFGGYGDLWGFTQNELKNLSDWEIQLQHNNTSVDEANTNYGDLQIIFHLDPIVEQNVQVEIEDENISYYGVFITDLKIPQGLKTDTDFLTIDGTDTNDAYRQNIREKTIEIDFEINEECNLKRNTDLVRQFTQLLLNEKDEYNRPIPKTISFSHMPDVYFEYIVEETMETEIDFTGYQLKAKLVIPAGTAYSKNTITTNNVGTVSGVASINPIITIQPIDSIVELVEENTKQKWNIAYSGTWTNHLVEIDCEDRIAWLKTDETDTNPVNISKYVDFNSDWFTLKGEYQFTATGCILKTVDYTERW